jgi:CRISPR-associated endonuclease/helicase Cas3
VLERSDESDEGTEEMKDDDWRESLRFDLKRNDDGEATRWLAVQKWRDTSNTENDRAEGRPQALKEHQSWAADKAMDIAHRLGLTEGYACALRVAARLHDEGKRAQRWQRAFRAERDAKKLGTTEPLAKTRGPINQQVLGGYRHEFGSLPHAKNDAEFQKLPQDMQDLVLHLIAAHHGYARPLIATDGCEDAPPSALEDRAREVALRFARLQKRWGPWGLAWWESLLRAADAQASRANDERDD